MVKGITKRVIVVKSPDRRLFDEAIFIVRDGVTERAGVTADDVIKEAQNVADSYIRANLRTGRLLRKLPPYAYALAGAMFTGAIWLITYFVL